MRRRWFGWQLLLASLAAGLSSGTVLAQKIIVNPNVQIEALDRNVARLIVTMRMPQWPDKQPVTVFVLPDQDPLHQEFTKQILEVYPYQLRRTWDRQVFSGTGQAPQQVRSEQEMIKRISQTAGAIGYVSDHTKIAGVKVIEVK
jgi:ABC-type phosphate transport system substrate-binding protein